MEGGGGSTCGITQSLNEIVSWVQINMPVYTHLYNMCIHAHIQNYIPPHTVCLPLYTLRFPSDESPS